MQIFKRVGSKTANMDLSSTQRADDALMSGANEEEEWRAVWREERVEMEERPKE